MRPFDNTRFALGAATGNRLRTVLLMLAMSIGVAAVVVLTALGDGARRYVVNEFSALGTNLVIVLPGRTQTGGFSPQNVITGTPRDLTIEDALAVKRATAARLVAPIVVGTSEISGAGAAARIDRRRDRRRLLRGAQLQDGAGPLPAGGGLDPRLGGDRARRQGARGRVRELAGARPVRPHRRPALPRDRRARLERQGRGMNTDELSFVPIATAQQMFNTNTLFRILVEARNREAIPVAKEQVREIIKGRHGGEEDVTTITQDAVLATFDRLLGTLTLGVAGIAAISLAVAGILVMNVMLVSVSQRTSEIGLLKALGATEAAVRNAFLTEAAMLSFAGALLGYGIGQLGAWIIRELYPTLPAYAPQWAVIAAIGTALVTGLLFGFLPARAAALDPVAALAKR